MARKTRDYKAEYARRIARGLKRGKSRTRARGHGKSPKAKRRTLDKDTKERLEFAYSLFRSGKSLSESSRQASITAERLQRFLRENGLVRKRKGKWIFPPDNRIREIDMLSTAGWVTVRVKGFNKASVIGHHRQAVRKFKDTTDVSALKPFIGKAIEDVRGKTHHFETRPNVLLQSFNSGRASFEHIYNLVSN